jgi:hypothetical protein
MRGAAPGKKDPASHLASISAFAHHAAQQCNYLIQPSSSSRQYLTAWRRQGQRLDAAPQHLPRISPAALASFPSAPRPGHLRRVVGAHRGVGLAPQPVGDHPLGELQEGWRRAPPPPPPAVSVCCDGERPCAARVHRASLASACSSRVRSSTSRRCVVWAGGWVA